MSDVKRYVSDDYLTESPMGTWVDYDKYAKLEAQIAALEAELARWQNRAADQDIVLDMHYGPDRGPAGDG